MPPMVLGRGQFMYRLKGGGTPVPLEFQGSAQETRQGAKISDSKAGANTNNHRPENHRSPHSAWEVGAG